MLIRFVKNEALAGEHFHMGDVRDLPLNIARSCMQRGSAVRADKPEPIRVVTAPANDPELQTNESAPPAIIEAAASLTPGLHDGGIVTKSTLAVIAGKPDPKRKQRSLWERLRSWISRQ